MALLGYCRVSTERQSLDQQVDALSHAGVEKIFTDKRSGAREDRNGLTQLLAYARPGDTVVVWRLDRLGRSLSHIVRTVADLQAPWHLSPSPPRRRRQLDLDRPDDDRRWSRP